LLLPPEQPVRIANAPSTSIGIDAFEPLAWRRVQ
jgi:hypothetical protein